MCSVLANSAPNCGAQTSCAGFDPGNGYFLILNRAQLHSSAGRFVITHELGHLVDFLGLDTFSHDRFKTLFSSSPKWKSCFHGSEGQCAPSSRCSPTSSAFFSTSAHGRPFGLQRRAPRHGRGVREPAAQAQWAFRPPQSRNPLAGFGPLAKSFENALHSGEDAL